MLTFRQMAIFRAVMESATLTEAAVAMQLSQPGVSKCIRDMENLLGFPLFRRESGRLAPTKEARSFYDEVLVALRAMESVARAAENYRDARSGFVRIAATSTLAHSLVPATIALFRRRRPAAQVLLHTALNHEVVRMVCDLQADFGLVLMPTNHAGTVARDLCATELVCILPADHPLAAHESLSPAEISRYPLISYNRNQPIGLVVDEQFERAGVPRVVATEITQSAAACSLVMAGAGIAVVDGYAMMNRAYPQLVRRPFRPAVDMVSRLIMAPAQEPTRLTKAFVECLETVIAQACERGELTATAPQQGSDWG
jgi:DNA-binding transcriptional LysR family regulator